MVSGGGKWYQVGSSILVEMDIGGMLGPSLAASDLALEKGDSEAGDAQAQGVPPGPQCAWTLPNISQKGDQGC